MSRTARQPGAPLTGIETITFDFGNTLVPVARQDLRRVVEETTRAVADRCGPFDDGAFALAWAEERERQFAEEVPRMREVDLAVRVVRILARLRGMPEPSRADRWDDAAAARYSTPVEVDFAVTTYSGAFVRALPPAPEIGPFLARLSQRYTLGILSNWPLAATIDAYVESAGWAGYLRSVVVSQRVGAIKPDLRIFRAAETALGVAPESRDAILHVGDDWSADVVGARRAGWRAAYVRDRPDDSPLPASPRAGSVEGPAGSDGSARDADADTDADAEADAAVRADVEVDRVLDLEAAFDGSRGVR